MKAKLGHTAEVINIRARQLKEARGMECVNLYVHLSFSCGKFGSLLIDQELRP
jgi:hypothetical protein